MTLSSLFPYTTLFRSVLQEQRVEPVGGTSSVPVDVRVIAATNKSLDDEIRRGTFREDLFFRLNVIPFQVPPLRERSEEHTSELQSHSDVVCRLLLEKK